MKYYIDFEAAKYVEEIISVGVVREDGKTFYSLVKPKEGKITNALIELTGLTKEKLNDAPNSEEVFEKLYDWVFNKLEDNFPEFYTWGSCDVEYIRHTFKRTNSLKARSILGYMSGSIRDFSRKICKKLKIDNIKLTKFYSYLNKYDNLQNHNSLDDAIMLYNIAVETQKDFDWNAAKNFLFPIMDFIEIEEEDKKIIKKKTALKDVPQGAVYFKNSNCKKTNCNGYFFDKKTAVEAIYNLMVKEKNRTTISAIEKKLTSCITHHTTYFGKEWFIKN